MAAKQSQELYRTLVEQAADGIFITDILSNYIDVNPSGCEMFGHSRDQLRRMRISDMISSEDTPALLQALSDLQLGKTTVTQWRFKRKDGTVSIGYWVLHSACRQMQAWQVRFGADFPKKIGVADFRYEIYVFGGLNLTPLSPILILKSYKSLLLSILQNTQLGID